MASEARLPDLICFSHLRWNFVYQRPQHLMSRFGALTRVLFVEEPVFDSPTARLDVSHANGVHVITPHLPNCTADEAEGFQQALLDHFLTAHAVDRPVLWYYTPMALPITPQLTPAAVVYDCMDELSAFAFAPPQLTERERRLLAVADLVFTGGYSLYRAKRRHHPRVYPFPSSVDTPHFARARELSETPDQAAIPTPKVGFFGVIDERMDRELLAGLADVRPDSHFILIGPVVKMEPGSLPRSPNLHYLGPRAYADLPRYLAGWQAAMLPFARNDATRFISPTKIPEYLAAGLPVVSTSIPDVVSVFGERGLVWIADSVHAFAASLDRALREDPGPRLQAVAAFLSKTSWDRTWAQMRGLLEDVLRARVRHEGRAIWSWKAPRAAHEAGHV